MTTTDEARCRACNVPFTEHLGLNGTCTELRRYRERADSLANLVAAMDKLITCYRRMREPSYKLLNEIASLRKAVKS